MTDTSRRALLALAAATHAAALASRASAQGTASPAPQANTGRAANEQLVFANGSLF